MRAKFYVDSATTYANSPAVELRLQPVMGGSEENTEFWRMTPSGLLEMRIENPEAQGFFEVGSEYYIDFSKAV